MAKASLLAKKLFLRSWSKKLELSGSIQLSVLQACCRSSQRRSTSQMSLAVPASGLPPSTVFVSFR